MRPLLIILVLCGVTGVFAQVEQPEYALVPYLYYFSDVLS